MTKKQFNGTGAEVGLQIHLRQRTSLMSLLQHPIIKAATFGEQSRPTILITTGWLLGEITQFSNEEYTPSSGRGHYPTTLSGSGD